MYEISPLVKDITKNKNITQNNMCGPQLQHQNLGFLYWVPTVKCHFGAVLLEIIITVRKNHTKLKQSFFKIRKILNLFRKNSVVQKMTAAFFDLST